MAYELVRHPAARANELGRPKIHKYFIASLSLCAVAAMILASGLARLLLGEPTQRSSGLICSAVGALMGVISVSWLLQTLQKLPIACDDCEKYGRHMFGLTFLLLVVGLSNAVGTSTLAFDGGLGFSAAALIEASNPQRAKEADALHEKAREALKMAERKLAAAERTRSRRELDVTRACSAPAVAHDSDQVSCETARTALVAAEEAAIESRLARNDAHDVVTGAQTACSDARAHSKRALFFLLSLSTMMSLFGASFYVVNRVRSKRPRQLRNNTGSGNAGALDDDDDAPSSAGIGANSPAAPPGPANSAQTPATEPARTESADRRPEPFDVHAFWSGAFFRVGEAVLFTFAFFWLIWTSDRRTDVVWLPVLGLFVGMFVKTGEAIIFRLGMRVLCSVEALLPTVPATPRGAPVAAAQPAQPPPPATPPSAHSRPQPQPAV